MASAPLPDLSAAAGDLRLGIDQPAGVWPTAPRLKSYEAAGFGFVQVTMPPRAVLRDPAMVTVHAGALRRVLALTGLALVLHAPADVMAGDRDGDACLRGALDYALAAGAGICVYHGRRVVPGVAGGDARLGAERRSLARLARRAAGLGIALGSRTSRRCTRAPAPSAVIRRRWSSSSVNSTPRRRGSASTSATRTSSPAWSESI